MNKNITLSIDQNLVERVRDRARIFSTTLNDVVRDSLRRYAGEDNLQNDLDYLDRYSGLGDSKGWKFNRDEIYERR